MGQKRMFSLAVIDTDRFMDMPVSSQALYFHLGMHGDDDGFVASPRKIARSAGCNDDDLRLLIQKQYIIPFESGVIVISDWGVNNTLRNDRYKPTVYQTEKALLTTSPNGNYIKRSDVGIPVGNQPATTGIPTVAKLEPQLNLTELNLTEHRVEGAAKPPNHLKEQKKRFVPPSVDEVRAYCQERGNHIDPQRFVDFYTANGWTQGRGKPIKDWRAAVRTWEGRDTGRTTGGNTKPVLADEDYDLERYLG